MQTDQLTFEALRHRVATIADEGSLVLKMVSSSPVATEANDCNVAIMDGRGAAVAIGPGLSSHAIGCMLTARHVIENYAENPGFGPGDMFLANDPYTCSAHQTCVALVTPVYWEDRVVAWVGAGIHLPDMGGPVPGQVSLGATSIYQEATPMPPLRIVEGGRIRKDIEAEFVARSRTQRQLALDLRALIAACERLSSRIRVMMRTHSTEALEQLFEDMIEFNRAHIEDRLTRIPEARWESRIWLDYPQGDTTEFYQCRLVLENHDGKLSVDLTDASSQSGAVINAGEPGLVSGILNALIVLLGYGLPRCPEAILRSIEVNSKPGTFVHAVHPAGCSKATTSACHAILMAFNLAVSRMFADSAEFEDRVLAGSGGFLPVIDLAGIDQYGERFGVPLLDMTLSSGFGGMLGKDGIDSAGPLHSPGASISNVETYEARYPILYLWRRQEVDSGGLGEFRGGRGVGLAWTPHKGSGEIGVVMHGHGCSTISTPGAAGGYPGATNTFEIARDTGCLDSLRSGDWPEGEEQFVNPPQPTTGLHMTRLSDGDVVIARNNGGGGFGDPLLREPQAVLEDIMREAVTEHWARTGYGVVTRGDAVDPTATASLREEMRSTRLKAKAAEEVPTDRGGSPTSCRYCSATDRRTVVRGVKELGRRILPFEADECFHAIETICTGCGTVVDVTIAASAQEDQAGSAVFVS